MNNNSSSRPSPDDADALTIVGIGASAGGLAALKTFFKHVPEDSGLAFVIVVHLAPEHKSHLDELLQINLKISVQQVTETMPIEPNHVYVIPPGSNLNTIDTHLRLSDLEEQRRDRAPIDHFLRTLARVHDGKAVGVILTGTGSDGTLGIREIKAQGGLTIVQDPNEAEYDGMPQSAIATGMIDWVLPLAKIPQYVLRFARTQPRMAIPREDTEPEDEELQLLHKVFTQVKSRTGRDFSRYKRSTIMRRLRRRMQLNQTEELSDYLTLLRERPHEVIDLSDDFLITVTNFFRDQEVFAQLEEHVIPQIFADKKPEQPVRVWSVGCSTGEEAYSLAILLLEESGRHVSPPELQVFASDLHDSSLAKAREGFYPGDIEAYVNPQRLRRFFTKEDGGYRIRKEVRDMVVFAPHNLLSDPPFSNLDLIACRNVLIYLQREVQRDVIDLFHYGLRPGSFLLLGTSETIETSELFHTEDKKNCLFRKRNVPAPELRLPVFPITQTRRLSPMRTERVEEGTVHYGELHQQIVERYAPPSLLVNPDYRVVHLSEHVGRYLIHPGGEMTNNIFKLVRPDFHIELRATLQLAQEEQHIAYSKPIPVVIDQEERRIILSVYPANESMQEGFFVVAFQEQPLSEFQKAINSKGEDAEDSTVRELGKELNITRQRLQTIIEEYETSQEEMKASNEEMQSTNEELRSTMEELETGKEELQSVNEELATLNQENRHKVEELSQLSGDLQNLLAATSIATLFLDRQFRIMRFTPQVSELFNVRSSDRGRPLTDITHRLGYHNLQEDAQQVLNKLVPTEQEVQDEKGRWYLTRILPYRSTEDRIEGVVITFIDITTRRQSEEALRQSEEQFRALVETSAQTVWTTNAEGQVVEDSPSWRDFTGQTFEEWKGEGWFNAVHPDDRDRISNSWQQAVQAGKYVEYNLRLRHKDESWRWMMMRAVPLSHPDGSVRGWVGMNTDITEQYEAEESLRQAKEEAERAAQAKEDFLAHMSHEIRTPLNAVTGITSLLLSQSPQPHQMENLETLRFSAATLKMLVDDILDFSKLQAGKVMVEEIDLNLKHLLNSLMKAHHPQAEERENQLRSTVDEQLPEMVRTDPLKLSQILNNLLSNAIKFTREGMVSVDVSLQKQEEDRCWATCSVQDTGVGIPADKLDDIFEAFTQADISTVRQYGGTGLGLSITKHLLELMGSRIEVESEVGKGTRFFFTLPLNTNVSEAPSKEVTTPASEQMFFEDKHVLLVEDAAINRMLLLQFLKEWWNLLPDEAENGQQALEKVQQKQYDLILMDIRMPVMDGYQAAQAIRGLPDQRYQKMPILALTADTLEEVQRRQKGALFTDVVTKPFDPQELRQKILRYTLDNKSRIDGNGLSATPVNEPALDLQKVEEIFKGDESNIRQFLETVREEFAGFRQEVPQVLMERNQEALRYFIHKTTMMLDMLMLSQLKALLEEAQSLLERKADNTSLEGAQQRIGQQLDEVLAKLDTALE